MAMLSLLHSPHFLLGFTVFCFIAALTTVELMHVARRKACFWSFVSMASLSIIFGLIGWIGFFVELLEYVHTGFNP